MVAYPSRRSPSGHGTRHGRRPTRLRSACGKFWNVKLKPKAFDNQTSNSVLTMIFQRFALQQRISRSERLIGASITPLPLHLPIEGSGDTLLLGDLTSPSPPPSCHITQYPLSSRLQCGGGATTRTESQTRRHYKALGYKDVETTVPHVAVRTYLMPCLEKYE